MKRHGNSTLYFIAILVPSPYAESIDVIKGDFAVNFGSAHALRSPPHITLIPPFTRSVHDEGRMHSVLKSYAARCCPFMVDLDGFGAFAPRVIYVRISAVPGLETLYSGLAETCRAELGIATAEKTGRSFNPHLTVAHRDLQPDQFHRAWEKYRERPFHGSFLVDQLSLLRHKESGWEVLVTCPFGK